jgi:hypothetical protein
VNAAPLSFRGARYCASADCRVLPGAEPVAGMRPYLLVRGHEHEGCL